MEKIQRDFLWGGERKIHLVKWDIVCTSKRKGGLGIRKLSNLNKALLGKWNWRFSMEEKAVWRSIISLKYGMEDGGWFSNSPRGSFEVDLWKDIGKEVIRIKQNCSYKVGNGRKVRFWRMSGAVKPPFAPLSLPSMRWLARKGIWWRICGKSMGQEEDETLDSRDT